MAEETTEQINTKDTKIYMLAKVYHDTEPADILFTESLIGFFSTRAKAYTDLLEDLQHELECQLEQARLSEYPDDDVDSIPVTENGDVDMNVVTQELAKQDRFYINNTYSYGNMTYTITEFYTDILKVQ